MNIIDPNLKENNNHEVILNRNVCLINHSNVRRILNNKNYEFDKSNRNFNMNEFISLENQYFMLEIQIRKPEETLSLNDKDDLQECYFLIVENLQDIVDLFSISKFLVYYEKDALSNYISKYIFDIINQFIRISENSLNFFEDLGITDSNEFMIFPLKHSIKKIRELFYQGKLLSYFKSDNRSLYHYINRILQPNENNPQQLKLDYPNYLIYKNIMDDDMFYQKYFKVKRRMKKAVSSKNSFKSRNTFLKIPEDYSDKEKNSEFPNKEILNITEFLEEQKYIQENNNKELISNNQEIIEEKSEFSYNHKTNKEKLTLENLKFLKNLNIENDYSLNSDSVFEFFFRVLNKSILKADCDKEEIDNQEVKKITLQKCNINSSFPFEERKYNIIDLEYHDQVNNKTENPIFIHPQINKKAKKIALKEKFFALSLKNSIKKHITNKGFFNIDIIMNEDEFKNMCNITGCCKKFNKKIGNFFYSMGNCFLSTLNSLLLINEGLIHKHFAIFSHSYNFNTKNRIFTFNSKYDASKKNKLRVYDILFNENWAEEIANLIILIYKSFYGMRAESAKINLDSDLEVFEEKKINSSMDKNYKKSKQELLFFMQRYKQRVDSIIKDFFESYFLVLPDFKNFCKNLAFFPISRYNVIDNLCQHFTNSCVQVLLNNSIMFFLKSTDIKEYNKNLNNEINIPNLETPIEPFLINVDNNLKNYLNRNGHYEDFVNECYKNEVEFIEVMKSINKYNSYCQNLIFLEDNKSRISDIASKLTKEFEVRIKIKGKIYFKI